MFPYCSVLFCRTPLIQLHPLIHFYYNYSTGKVVLSGRSLVCSDRRAIDSADQAWKQVDTTRACVLNRLRVFSDLLLYIKFAINSVGNRDILIFRDSCHLSQFHLLPFAFCMGAFDSHRTHCCTLYKSTQDNLKKPENPSLLVNETGREVTVVSIHIQQIFAFLLSGR